ncbi:MAG: hypothetical protein NUV49_04300, partial [Patescibacteria group bacterium]|nr:hypothetical protein [Patescibacteria group bacterium]
MNSNEIIPTSEERREKRAKQSFSWRPSEVGTKGLIPFIKKKDFFYGHFSDRRLVVRYIMAGGTGAFVNI